MLTGEVAGMIMMSGGGDAYFGAIEFNQNGTYTPQSVHADVDGWNQVTVNVNTQPTLQDKTITENGSYTADSGYDGLGTVTVAVSVPISPLTVNANGTYTATSGGYSPVTVDVPTYEQEYQEALEQLQEMQQCCADVADMLGTEAGCSNIKQAVAELIIGSYPSTDDIPTDPEQEVGRYVSISSNGYAIIDTSWDGWYFVQGGWHRGGAYYNTKTVVMKKYNMSGELLSTTKRTLPVWVNTDNGGYDPPPDPGWSDGYKFEQLQNTSYRHYSAAVNTLTWYWDNWTPTGDPPSNTGFTLDTSIT
jgi:hypothetical protein